MQRCGITSRLLSCCQVLQCFPGILLPLQSAEELACHFCYLHCITEKCVLLRSHKGPILNILRSKIKNKDLVQMRPA